MASAIIVLYDSIPDDSLVMTLSKKTSRPVFTGVWKVSEIMGHKGLF